MSDLTKIAATLEKVALEQFRAAFGEEAAARLNQEKMFLLELVQRSGELAKAGRFNSGLHLAPPKELGRRLCEIAILGLSYNPSLGLVYPVNYKGAVSNMISYKGEIFYLQQKNVITRADCKAIHENDFFQWEEVNGEIRYKYRPELANPGKIIGAFCVYHLPGGALHGRAITRGDIDKRRNVAKSGKFWQAWEKEMILKTAARMARHGLPTGQAAEAVGQLEAVNNQLSTLDDPRPAAVDPDRLEEIKEALFDLETKAELATAFKALPSAERSNPEIKQLFTNAKNLINNA